MRFAIVRPQQPSRLYDPSSPFVHGFYVALDALCGTLKTELMALPSDPHLIDALIKAMHRLGRSASIDEQEAEVARLLSLPKSDLDEIQAGTRTKFSYRLAWARTYLKGLGLLRSVDRAVWELTEEGRKYSSVDELRKASSDVFDDLFDESQGVEGVDEESAEDLGEYPIDSVLIRQESRSVFEVVRRIRDSKFIMDPDFQRDFIWATDKQSKLIESMLMRIPLPVFYLAERDDGRTVVVDGLQRLSTFERFLGNELILRDLQLAPELNGKKFEHLSAKLQNRIEDTQLILYLIDSKVPEQAKLDIFDRVNGGVPLTRQQMRNSIYCGSATRWLKNEVQTPEFLNATSGSLDWRTMRDRECVNRFCGFTILGPESYLRGDMDSFLALTLKKMNAMNEATLSKLSADFRRSLRNNYEIFGAHCFRKHYRGVLRRSVLNVALFDVFSVLLAKFSEEEAMHLKSAIQKAFFDLMEDVRFVDAISFSTNSTLKVKTRFLLASEALTKFVNA